MRFVAGRGAVAELLAGSAMAGLLAGSAMAKRMAALWQRAIGKSCWQGRLGRVAGRGRRRRPWKAGTATSTSKESNLPEGSTIGKQARKEPPRCKRTKKRAAKPTLS